MATSTAQSSPGVLPAANVRSSADPFPSDEFTTIVNIPIFAEHVAARKDGTSIKFGLDELQAICDRCNRRIDETGDFAAITLGHTPSPDNATGWEPEVIGFAGPYRIGRMPGTRKYAILADFHVFKGRENELRKRPRRSPELWMSETPEDMFLDPIALLGALPPRLDMGMLYAKVQEGREVWKYAASGPSPSSVFVPDGTGKKVKQYAKQTGEAFMLDPDEIQQILDALEQLDWVQQAKSMAAGEVGNNATPEGGPPGAPPGPMGPPQGAMPPGPGTPPEAAAGPPPGLAGTPAPPVPKEQGELPAEEEPDKEKSAMAEPETCPTCGQEVKKANYQAEGDAQGAGLKNTAEGAVEEPGKPKEGTAQQGKYAREGQKVRYAMEQQQYGAVGHKLKDLEAEVATLKGQVGTERCKRIEAERYAALNDRRQHYVMDVDKEVERCRYAKMTDEQFAAHIEVIDNNYRRIPIGEQLPLHGRGIDMAANLAERPGLERSDYSKAASDEALDKCLTMAARGEKVDYGQVLTEIKSRNHQPLKT